MNQDFDFKKMRQDLMDEITNTNSAVEALQKLSTLREKFDSAIPGYLNSLKILSDTTYENRKHFLLELIQNADDADFESRDPYIKFIIYADRLVLQYNEKGFNIDNVIAITDTGGSTKSGTRRKASSFIGEKGIGFKSVFALAESVEIKSLPWHFSLHKDNCIIPKIVFTNDVEELTGTQLTIRFIDKNSLDIIAEELNKFFYEQVETFLFLQTISEFVLEDKRNDLLKNISLSITPTDRDGNRLCLNSSTRNDLKEYAIYSQKLIFPKELVVKRWEKLGQELGELERRITVAAPYQISDISRKEGRLFCFLPTEVKLPIPIYLQVDGHTKADRERLHDPVNNEWNSYLLKNIPEIIRNAIMEWRQNKSISDKLINYIPLNSGNDQLKNEFNNLKQLLKSCDWIKTNDEGEWVSPAQAVIPSIFLKNLIKDFPQYRKDIERTLGKKLVFIEWCNVEGIQKLTEYDVKSVSDLEFAKIMRFNGYPNELLNDNKNLIYLYDYILNLSQFKSNSWYRNKSEYESLKQFLKFAPIFPIEGEGFSKLKINSINDKIFWLATFSKRETGIIGQNNNTYRIVDPKYTYKANESGENKTDEYKEKMKEINTLNDLLRKLLNLLEVEELNEETLLNNVQIPILLNDENYEMKVEILMSIFEVYKSKRNYEDEYCKDLYKISDAKFLDVNNNVMPLKDLVLPRILKTMDGDSLYENLKLSSIYIPNDLIGEFEEENTVNSKEKEQLINYKEKLRQFLIFCGIRVNPSDDVRNIRYDNAGIFLYKDKELCNEWKKRIKDDYTYANSISIYKRVLDKYTLQLLINDDYNKRSLASKLYELWLKENADCADDTKTLYYSSEPPFGYLKIKYTRRESRAVLIRTTDWGGCSFDKIPLIAIDGSVQVATKVRRINATSIENLKVVSSIIPLVLENKDNRIGYSKNYLDSIGISEIRLSDLNDLWSMIPEEEHDLILQAAIELLDIDLLDNGLLIYDTNKKELIPASYFRLGTEQYNDVPMIELQYGKVGKSLGELLGLSEENGVSKYLGIFRLYFLANNEEQKGYKEIIYHILKNWAFWSIESKNRICDDLKNALKELNISNKPMILINEPQLESRLKFSGGNFISLSVFPSDVFVVSRSADELGFLLPSYSGELIIEGESIISESNKEKITQLSKSYLEQLDSTEQSRLFMCLNGFGKEENWGSRVREVEKASRAIDINNNIYIDINLPYLDTKKHLLLVKKDSSNQHILACLFSLSGFERYKNAYRDLKDLKVPTNKYASHGDIDVFNNVNENNINFSEVKQQIKQALLDGRINLNNNIAKEWRLGMTPEEEQVYRDGLSKLMANSIDNGPLAKERKDVKRDIKGEQEYTTTKQELTDPHGINSKEFLLTQYGGRCQVCGEQIILLNGSMYLETYHIREAKEDGWWVNRPYNILGLCPNCHAKAKYGGDTNLSGVYTGAKDLINGDIFPGENEKFQGDYYNILITLNGERKQLVLSKEHLNSFAVLWDDDENIEVTENVV
jgi:hypothetical protein